MKQIIMNEMKSYVMFIPVLMMLLGFSSCYEERDLGNVIIQEREMDDFYGINLGGIGDATLISSPEFKVEVRTHVNLMDDVITTLEGGILNIDLIGNHKSIDILEYRIYTPYVNYIKLDNVGNIYCQDGFSTQSIKIIQDGVGNIRLQNISADEIDVTLDDVGDIYLSGTAGKEFVVLDGVGNYDAFDLNADTVDVFHDGVGDVKVSVNDYLKVVAQGVGKVYYKGDPVVDANVSGVGGLIKVN